MGSPLGPTLANIIMTEFETVIIKPLINSGIIVFYKRNVDDTLVLAKPSDIKHILNTIGVRDGGAGGAAAPPPPKRLQSRKVGQMFNKSRAKSGKLKSQKTKKPPVCWANKGSRAIFASQSGNIGLLQKEL